MIHHASLGVSNIERASAFYDAALAPLGYVRIWEDLRPGEPNQAIGYGPEGSDDKLAIKFKPKGQRSPGHGFHLAFEAPNRNAVASFHQAALDHGGLDNGGPGLRLQYGPHYYAAFVIDPDGHNIEAVFNSALEVDPTRAPPFRTSCK
ncbi:VOC family protein [Burkholderia gladioli]|uniref:VOC family protein n=1 Tax=Burkholderia gladioli TaxID=28095 RepID=UPI00163E511E|nr:VOC family protein [Burkholderia gladioli]